MTTVKCPICKDRLTGASTADLNQSLREHLADVHEMRDLTTGPRGGVPTGTYTAGRTGPTERPVEREYVREERVEPRESMRERMGAREEPERRHMYEGTRDYPYIERRPDIGFSAPQSRTLREVETWSNRDPRRFERENYIPREEVRQWRYPVTGPYGERGPTSSERLREGLRGREEEERYERREGYEERRTGMMGRESEMPTTISCPMCGNTVRGRDEDDLSDELRMHMREAHDIRPKMTERFRV